MPRDSDACRMENAIKEDNVDRRIISARKSEALREPKAVGKTERACVYSVTHEATPNTRSHHVEHTQCTTPPNKGKRNSKETVKYAMYVL